MTGPSRLSRRDFVAGSLIVAIALPRMVRSGPNTSVPIDDGQRVGEELNAFLSIAPDGQITFVAPSAELGQGIYTSQAQIIAEELECDFARIRVVAAPADESRYANPLMHSQTTVSSAATRAFFGPLRQAGARARMRLIAAAARRWDVASADCHAANGVVIHESSGRRLDYGALASAAAREVEPAPESIVLKPASAFRQIGQSVARVDTAAKINGRAIFGIDVVRPGMKYAAVDYCPLIGGALGTLDPAPALAVKGVRQVIRLPAAIAVLADHSWAALKGLTLLKPQWTGGDPALNDAVMVRQLADAARQDEPTFKQAVGDADTAIANADDRIDAVYELPFLAHAPLEPLNAVVDLKADGCDIWLGTQAPVRVQLAAAKESGLPLERIRVWNLTSGGGFGRRASADYIPVAIAIARAAGVPVKMFWSREQDMRGGRFRPRFRHEIRLGLKDGRIDGWHHRIVGGSAVAALAPQLLKQGPDINAVEGATKLIYKVGPTYLDYVRADPPLPLAFWRSVGPGHNMFVVEGAINEAATKLATDPFQFRRSVLNDDRARTVLDLVEAQSQWHAAKDPRVGRGVAVQYAFGSYLACVIEAAVSTEGEVSLRRVTLALDVGQAINPDGVVSQVEGAVVFGLSAALWGEITVTDGRITQTNFHNYRVLRINETPKIDVHVVASAAPPGGLGEAGTSIVFPALAAAIHDATGVRLRSLPFDRHAALVSKNLSR